MSNRADHRLKVAAIVLVLIGLGVSGYLTYVKYTGGVPSCQFAHGCATVQNSSYATFAGIPVPLLGILGYLSILVALFIRGDLGRLAGATLSLVGFGFSAYLTYLELFVINAICQYCVVSAVVMTLLAVVSLIRMFKAPLVLPGENSSDS